MRKLETKEAEEVKKAAIAFLSEWKPFLHTITADNGKEFAQHQEILRLWNWIFILHDPSTVGKETRMKI